MYNYLCGKDICALCSYKNKARGSILLVFAKNYRFKTYDEIRLLKVDII